MGFVFVSHASEDKIPRVKPLVEALALEGVKLWLDRPGFGENHFNLNNDFITLHDVNGLTTGQPWHEQIKFALNESGAILVCLSKSLCIQRQVLVQELLLGWYSDKLVTCIVDDLSYSDFPSDLGLPDISRLQAERIHPPLVRQAVDWLNEHPYDSPEKLPQLLKIEWEIIRKLVRDINALLKKNEPHLASVEEISAAIEQLSLFPIFPMVYAHEIPIEVVNLFADLFTDPEKSKRFLSLAMQILSKSNPENFTDRQLLVRSGETLNPYQVSADQYWGDVLTVAGGKSRRTLASFLVSPGAPNADKLPQDLRNILITFKNWLNLPQL
jgi:hypothetical protein